MSWFKGLAGKAEDFLNQIDQNAAVAFQNGKEKDSSKKEDVLTEVTWNTPSPSSGFEEFPGVGKENSKMTTSEQVSKPKHEEDLQYISPDQTGRASAQNLEVIDSISQESASIASSDTIVTLFRRTSMPSSTSSNVASSMSSTTSSSLQPSELFEEITKENSLLKQELRAAYNEISSVLHRAKSAEKAYSELQTKMTEIGSSRKSVELLQKREIVAVEQNSEAPHEVLMLIKQNPTLINDLENKVKELTSYKTTTEEQMKHTKQEFGRLEEMCEKLRHERNDAKSELEHYKSRAQRVLLEKERTISELRSESSGSGTSLSLISTSASSMLEETSLQELERLQQEKELLREENLQVSVQLRAARDEVIELEKRFDLLREHASDCELKLQAEILEERRRRQAAEEDARIHAEELRAIQEELSRQRSLLANRVRERELELTRLRGQLTQRPSSVSEDELEHRLHALTQTLVQKQTSLETVSTERNALRLQLEKLEDKYRHIMALLQQYQSSQTAVNDTDDAAKAQVPALFIESPFDTGISLRVKRAYSTLDAVSIRTGVFLRRYPLARILVFWYIILLHLWVVFVLLSYSPSPQ